MIQRNDATEAQVQAARPAVSTWLSANAGSGKTRVLTDRVARLLLSQVPPERILCLTYTKAAASEMQNRLFKRLGAWAMLPDDKLRAALVDLGEERQIDDAALRQARTLFAAAIETPGGLKIQTIHSFCSSILRRFPMEAGVSPQFTEMEDRASALLREEIIEEMAQGGEARLLSDLARICRISDFDEITSEITGKRGQMHKAPSADLVYAQTGGDAQASKISLVRDLFDPATKEVFREFLSALTHLSDTYKKLSARLSVIDLDDLKADDLDVLLKDFIDSKGTPKSGRLPQANHKKAREAVAHLLPQVDDLIDRTAQAKDVLTANLLAEQSLTLARFAEAFIAKYENRKAQAGLLDFDDLILKTRDLLTDSRVAAWVLFRLDGGIDHILVDEAQDTSPEQWQVIERLSEDFVSGEGARSDVPRTIFVVGDKKQSIYSFQGADPRAFDHMFTQFDDRLKLTNAPLVPAQLHYSFRSAQCILELVDATFETQTSAGFSAEAGHKAFENGPPGRVDIWPLIEPKPVDKSAPKPEITDTLDKLAEDHHTVQLARRIAGEIKRIISEKEPIFDGDLKRFRAVTAGDFLILVQQRNELFEEIIRACKEAELPIAGADRLKVGAELAVRDIQALLSFLALPEDDFSLAVALKSPLFGWSEKQLYDLAQGRGKSFLWQQMRKEKERYAREFGVLNDLLGQSDFMRPYDLIERILTRHDGRRHILARLGHEAEDGIDALLSQALAFERSRIPSLTGFLTWMESDDLTIKRQTSQARDEIRVMTVHGSKGLEAPIVMMPDTAKKRPPSGGRTLDMGGFIGWNPAKAEAPEAAIKAKEAQDAVQAEERMRLLYVAMTRAEKWLILAAAGDIGSDPDQSWYGLVTQAAQKQPVEDHAFSFGLGQRIQHAPWGEIEEIVAPRAPALLPALEPWLTRPAPQIEVDKQVINPSDLDKRKALPSDHGLDEEAAMERGTQIHLLLEHFAAIPEDHWRSTAERLLPDHPDLEPLIEEAASVLHAPDLRFVFAPGSLAEVALTARPEAFGGKPLYGIVDRLIVNEAEVWAIDFKTNAGIPETPDQCPEGILQQMGAYRGALAEIYPNHQIKTAIVWTGNASLMHLPDALVDAALERAGQALQLDAKSPNT